MHKLIPALLLVTIAAQADAASPQHDYFAHNRLMIRNGVQAVLMCNGLFTSHRELEQVFRQELAYLPRPVGDAGGGNYRVDPELRAVSVGGGVAGPAIGCSVASVGARDGIGTSLDGGEEAWPSCRS